MRNPPRGGMTKPLSVNLVISSQKAVTRETSPDKVHLRALDVCLGLLEDANERGETLVSDQLAARFITESTWLRPGMPIRDALDGAFGQQERILRGSPLVRDRQIASGDRGWLTGAGAQGGSEFGKAEPLCAISHSQDLRSPSLSGDQARELTEQIKIGVRSICLLILTAHDGRAWIPLGYSSWEAYVRAEFGFSRSRSYELLTQGRVMSTIQSAAGLSGMPDISTRLAIRLSVRLEELAAAIHRKVSSRGTCDPDVVASVISEFGKVEQRRKESPALLTRDDGQRRPGSYRADDANVSPRRWVYAQQFWLGDVIDYLARMPAISEVLQVLDDEDAAALTQLDSAVQRLSDLAAAWPRPRQAMSA
jgi:hypothetical protein